MKKRFLIAVLCAAILLCAFPARGLPEDAAAGKPAFPFRPKAASAFMDEIYGETLVQAWYSLVDAVLAGEDTFACPDEDTYSWVIHQFPDRYFPVLTELIRPVYGGAVKNGRGRFIYEYSPEETRSRLAAFADLVEEILREALRPEYTDLEKILALYRYFYDTYRYDDATFGRMQVESVDSLSSWRLLSGGTGVCQEIARAYSYLLLQAGVDATVVIAQPRAGGMNHEWSLVRLGGRRYHVDPTYAISEPGSLEYFLMTDEKRSEEFAPEKFILSGTWTQEHGHPPFSADDDTFRPLWSCFLVGFDHDARVIHCVSYDDGDSPVYSDFPYEGF